LLIISLLQVGDGDRNLCVWLNWSLVFATSRLELRVKKNSKRLATIIRPRETSDPNEGSEVFKGHYFATICNELSN